MTVAGLNALVHNEKPPGVGALGRLELNQAGAWCMCMGYVAVPHFAQPEARSKRAVPMSQNDNEIMGSAAA